MLITTVGDFEPAPTILIDDKHVPAFTRGVSPV